MTNPTELHDRDLERDLCDLLRERALDVTGPPPDLDAVRLRRATAGAAADTTSRPRPWLAVGVAAALLAAGAAGVAFDRVDRDTASPVVAGSSNFAVPGSTEGTGTGSEAPATPGDAGPPALAPRSSESVVLDSSADGYLLAPEATPDAAGRAFLTSILGPTAADAATVEKLFPSEHESEMGHQQLEVTLPGQEPFSVTTLVEDDRWQVRSGYRRGFAVVSSPRIVPTGPNGEMELLLAHPHGTERAVVWYLDADGKTLEAELDRAILDAGRRDAREEVETVLEADGFRREALSPHVDLTGVERGRGAIPGLVHPQTPVVIAYFNADDHPMAIWMNVIMP